MNYNTYNDWRDAVLAKGLSIENDGGSKMIAHLDGIEYGWWDPLYGGVGFGEINLT